MQEDEYIMGPPGTGKTTTLINRIATLLESGTPPDRIGLITFTKRAAEVAVARLQDKYPGVKFPHIRTLHSMAFQEMGVGRSSIMNNYHLVAAAIHLPMRRSPMHNPKEGDRVFQAITRSRTTGVSLEQAAQEDGVDWTKVDLASRALASYKGQTGLMDFNDLLDEWDVAPDLDYLLVDEAQDLSKAQWDKVDMFDCPKIIVGDDDQAIFGWAGADTNEYIKRVGKNYTVLNHSWRLPANIHGKANQLINLSSNRVNKIWNPRSPGGSYRVVDPDIPYGFNREGTYMVLVLFLYQLIVVARRLREAGIYYEMPDGKPSVPQGVVEAHRLWEIWRTTGKRPLDLSSKVRKYISSWAMQELVIKNQVPKDSFLTHAERITDRTRVYYSLAVREATKGERPRVRMSTVHRAKGDEADNVLLINPPSKRTRKMHHGTRDDLIRLLYVGMTRARETLYVTSGGELI